MADQSLLVTTSGLREILNAQTVHANNLANASTPGFHRDFADIQNEMWLGDGLNTRNPVGDTQLNTDFKPGEWVSTGDQMHVALGANHYLSVQDKSGQTFLTQRGDLALAPDGTLINGQNLAIMGDGGPIQVTSSGQLSINREGDIYQHVTGTDTPVLIGKLKVSVVEPQNLSKQENGLFLAADGAPEAEKTMGLQVGFLNGSNVNPVEEMLEILNLSRQFEIQMKMIDKMDENDSLSSQLINLQG